MTLGAARLNQTNARPRLGFVGTGWIGRLRMEALQEFDLADFSLVFDPVSDAAQAAAAIQAGTEIADSFQTLLEADIDALVIASPSAMHAEHCIAALEHGKAVFCQKPLARNLEETRRVVDAARQADRYLGVDFSYRYLAGVEALREMIANGSLGKIFTADLVFHNAYGPDKDWFYQMESAGGGCVMDLGIHLVDWLFWLLGRQPASLLKSQLFKGGQRLTPPYNEVEDFASVQLRAGETHAQLCCSWNLHAGQDAIIQANFYGTEGGAAIRNVNGSFFDFDVHVFRGTQRQHLAGHPDPWGGRALAHWTRQLAAGLHYRSDIEDVLDVAQVLDRIYHR